MDQNSDWKAAAAAKNINEDHFCPLDLSAPGASAPFIPVERSYNCDDLALKEAQIKIEYLQEKMDSLKEERDYLRERLKEALAKKVTKEIEMATSSIAIPQSVDTDSGSESSGSTRSSESGSSGEKKKSGRNKRREKHKKSKHHKSVHRVRTPDDSIRRYQKVLSEVKRGRSKAMAYSRLNVDRNTIVSQAPIAELAATNPTLYVTLRSTFKPRDSLKTFAETCRGFCMQEPTASAIAQKKSSGSLLDIFKN